MAPSYDSDLSGGAMILRVYFITAFSLICDIFAVDNVLQVVKTPLITLTSVYFGHRIWSSEGWVEELPHVGRRKLMDDDYC